VSKNEEIRRLLREGKLKPDCDYHPASVSFCIKMCDPRYQCPGFSKCFGCTLKAIVKEFLEERDE
jgi:hypothetical protein